MLGPRKLALTKGEFVVSFLLPPRPPRSSDAYLRFIPRTEMDIAVVGAGVSLTLDAGGTITAARVSLGAVAARVLLVRGGRPGHHRQPARPAGAGPARGRGAGGLPPDRRQARHGRIPHPGRGRAGAPGGPDRAGPSEDRLMAKHHIEATVNGDAVEFLCETEDTLLDVLRDTLAPDRQQGRLLLRRLRRVQRHAGRPAGLLVPRAGLRGRRAPGRHDRGRGQGGGAAPAAAEVPGARRAAVRDLHAGLPRGRQGAARAGSRTRPIPRSATGWPATCAGARATTRS